MNEYVLIHVDVCDKIEKGMNAFSWKNGKENKGIRWLSWDQHCTVKEDGGLGFKKFQSVNTAMLARKAWRLINNVNPLVIQIMSARYFPNTDFINAKIGSNMSYVWHSILESHDILRHGCRRRIGDGKSMKVWNVSWIPCTDNGFLTTDMPVELQDVKVHN